MKTRKSRNKQSGFSLMEVLFVSLLLFMLSYYTFTTTRSTMSVKRSIDARSEILQSGRAVVSLFTRDVRNVFFVDSNDLGWNPPTVKSFEEWIEEGKKEEEITPEMVEPPPPKPVPVTLFQGTSNELLFSSRSHQRISADSPENNEHFVRYRVDKSELIREETYRAIRKEDITENDQWRAFSVIENVKTFELSYYNDKTLRWEDEWDTNSSRNLDVLPAAVRLKLVYTPTAMEEGDEINKDVSYETSIRLLEKQFRHKAVEYPR